MVSYFGWIYVLVLTACIILGSILIGYSMGMLVKDDPIISFPQNPA
jgi:hypothetical protein